MILAHVILKPHLHPEEILGIGGIALIIWGLYRLASLVERRRK